MNWIFGHFIQVFSNFSWFFYKLMTFFERKLSADVRILSVLLGFGLQFYVSLIFLSSLRWSSRTLSRIISWPSPLYRIIIRIRNYTRPFRSFLDTFPHIFDKLFGFIFDRIGVIVFRWSTIFRRFRLPGCRFLGLTALIYRKNRVSAYSKW